MQARKQLLSAPVAVLVPGERNPSLPTMGSPLQYVDIFIDDFVSATQHPVEGRVRRTLLHAIDNVVFRPLSDANPPFLMEPISLKKPRKGDYSWDTTKLVLG